MTTNTILALIHNGNLSENELVVAIRNSLKLIPSLNDITTEEIASFCAAQGYDGNRKWGYPDSPINIKRQKAEAQKGFTQKVCDEFDRRKNKENIETIPFQTSKDLKTLEKELKEKGMAVHLHKKEVLTNAKLGRAEDLTEKVRKEYSLPKTGMCVHETRYNKPIMLAVFGDRKTIEGMV